MLRKGLPFSSYSSQILSRPNLPRPIRSLLPVMDLNISVSFRRKQDVDDPGCIQTLQGTVRLRADDGSSQYVGSIKAYRIDRRACKEEFYDILGCRGETRRFSRACFDKLGFVHSRLLMDEYHKGSGCWQEEVNRGKIVYISNIFIEEQYRSRGIGSRVLKALVDLDYVNDVDIVYCEPVSPDPSDIEDQTLSMDPSSQARRTSFFHKVRVIHGRVLNAKSSSSLQNGFRRLGRTSWLAFSCDPSHPSRSLDISDEPRDDSQFSHDPVMTGKICQSDFPLNWAILNDKERSPSSIGRVVAMIRDAHEVSPAAIHAQDPIGATPLHMAGMCGHVQAIRTLLELGASSDLNIRNSYGKTPSDCCIEELEEIRRSQERTWRQMMGISCWAGFPETKLRALGILRHAMGLEITEEEFMKQYKFGCTCGSCVDGWLSKRMKYYLIKCE
ncbi:hypothetical protein FRC02_006314 [Tulasnella sp. 418]|nr:hypothetical protein FRC02_006314 [Tulasnella sp. 418]